METSALTSSLPDPLTEVIDQLAAIGFRSIDVPPQAADAAAQLAAHGLRVGCVKLEGGVPDGMDLASADAAVRRAAVQYYGATLEAAAALDAPVGYLTPPIEGGAGTRELWCESLVALADRGRQAGVRLAIEHFPRRLVPTAAETLALLDELNHPQLALLVDVGHCMISREAPADVIRAAGERLAYVHFDDNDGVHDLHWPLLSGALSQSCLRETVRALRQFGYAGSLCLELHSELPSPLENLVHGKRLLDDLLAETAI